MKVRIEFTIDVDNDAWTLNYGVEGEKAIRQDVKAYSTNLVVEHFADLGLLTEEA
jgi:hypothetical protein